jgi:hypothetical protein
VTHSPQESLNSIWLVLLLFMASAINMAEYQLRSNWFPALQDGLAHVGADLIIEADLTCALYGDLFRPSSKALDTFLRRLRPGRRMAAGIAAGLVETGGPTRPPG